MRSITILFFWFCALLAWDIARAQPPAREPLRIGTTPVIAEDQYVLLNDWQRYLEKQLQRPVAFVPRDSYRETIDLLKNQQIEFAWVSTYPFVYLEDEHLARLLAVPKYKGRPSYRAYLIVPAGDKSTRSIDDLAGRIFAFADPYSHSGYIYARHLLKESGNDRPDFFRRTFFTWSHGKLIRAVAEGYAEGACVDGYVWDSLAVLDPAITARTRIVGKSGEFAFPPMVAGNSVTTKDFAAMQAALLKMSADPEGAKLLARLHLDGFVRGDPGQYAPVRQMSRAVFRK